MLSSSRAACILGNRSGENRHGQDHRHRRNFLQEPGSEGLGGLVSRRVGARAGGLGRRAVPSRSRWPVDGGVGGVLGAGRGGALWGGGAPFSWVRFFFAPSAKVLMINFAVDDRDGLLTAVA